MPWITPVSACACALLGMVLSRLAGHGVASSLAIAAFSGALAIATVVDLREARIPNRLTYPGTLIALTVAGLQGWDELLQALSGAVAATAVMGIVFVIGRGRLGLGDVKLAGFAGSVLGLNGVPPLLLGASIIGAIVAGTLLLAGRSRQATFAYGPCLAAGAVFALVTVGPLIQ